MRWGTNSGAVAVQDVWTRNLPEEVSFWDDYVRTGGLEWPDEFRMRVDPDAPLSEREILSRLPSQDPVRILDVGAGPLTALGKQVAGRRIEIVAVDPLADEYAAILARHGVIAPVVTRRCEGEALSACFAPATFDFAYARNALDHSYDPRVVVGQMLRVVKPGGYVILRHRPNEGMGAGYAGLHQWNFDLQDEQFWIWNQSWRYNMHSVLATRAAIECHRDGEWLVCVLRKLPRGARLLRVAPAIAAKAARLARRATRAALRHM